MDAFRDAFINPKRCKGCEAKDVTIALLTQRIDELKNANEALTMQVMDINRHLLRMNNGEVKENVTHSSYRPQSNSIASRVKRAEEFSRKAAEEKGLPDQRRKEYEERIETLTKPVKEDNEDEEKESETKH